MPDHQQAAIKALQEEVYVQLSGHYGDFNIPSEEEAESILAAAEPHLRKKWAEEWGIGDETSRPLYDARLRIGELEGEVHYKDREIRRLDFELNIALGFQEGAGE